MSNIAKFKRKKKKKQLAPPSNVEDLVRTVIPKVEVKTKMPDNQTAEEYIESALKEADTIYRKLAAEVERNPGFKNLPDEEKISWVLKEHKEFQMEFPIVCRYMICLGSYHPKAFTMYLEKTRKCLAADVDKREEGYREDQWCRRQADYVKYLYAAMKGIDKFNRNLCTQGAKDIWTHTYEGLVKEFKDFRDLHKKAEEKVKTRNEQAKIENADELMSRLKNNTQNLSKRNTRGLIDMLRQQVFLQRKTATMKEIVETAMANHATEPLEEKLRPDGSRNVILKYIEPSRVCHGDIRCDKSKSVLPEDKKIVMMPSVD